MKDPVQTLRNKIQESSMRKLAYVMASMPARERLLTKIVLTKGAEDYPGVFLPGGRAVKR